MVHLKYIRLEPIYHSIQLVATGSLEASFERIDNKNELLYIIM